MYYKYPNCFSKNTTWFLRGFTLVRDYIILYIPTCNTHIYIRARLILGLPGFHLGTDFRFPLKGFSYLCLEENSSYYLWITYRYMPTNIILLLHKITCNASEINGGHVPHTMWCAMS